MRRISLAAVLAALCLFGGGLMAAGPAQAAPTAVTGSGCNAWISGEWGHGKCWREHAGGGRWMKLDVICDAWWDADIHREAWVPDPGSVELQGHCYSSVVSSSATWK